MSNSLYSVFHSICKDSNIDHDVFMEALNAGISLAARKHFGIKENVTIRIEEEDGIMEILLVIKVVEDPTNDYTEISLQDARDIYDPDLEIDDEILEELDVSKFSRTATQIAKQIISQRLKEVEREDIYNAFKDREGEIITGVVQQVGPRVSYISLGKTYAILPYKEQARGEMLRTGERVKVYIQEVRNTNRDCQIIVSRRDPRLVKGLFRLEVPEIDEGMVEIVNIVREAGERTKLSVRSTKEKVDAMGACVGVKGSRVHAVVQELRNERIDIVRHNDDPAQYIAHALNPAKLSNMTLNHAEHTVVVVVPQDQLSLAIGRKGQNVRLGSQLTGWEISVISEEKYKEQGRETFDSIFKKDMLNSDQDGEEQKDEEAPKEAEAENVEAEEPVAVEAKEVEPAKAEDAGALATLAADLDINERLAGFLIDAGYDSMEKVAALNREEVLGITGIGPKTTDKIIAVCGGGKK